MKAKLVVNIILNKSARLLKNQMCAYNRKPTFSRTVSVSKSTALQIPGPVEVKLDIRLYKKELNALDDY